MEKLRLCMAVLLFGIVAVAQTVTEKDMLGTWYLKTMDSPGLMYIDFDKDSVAMVQDVKAAPQAKEIQQLIIGGLNEEIAKIDGTLTFLSNGTFVMKMRHEQEPEKYSLKTVGAVTYMYTETKDTIAVSVINGTLLLTQQVNKRPVTLTYVDTAQKKLAALQQPIPEAALLGTWEPLYITAIGCSYNYKTGAVTLPDAIINKAKKTGEDIEALKAQLAEALKSVGFADMKIIFKPGNIVVWSDKGISSETHYAIVKKDGALYLKRPDGRDLKVDFKDGHFKILKPNSKGGADTEIVFDKK